MKNKYTLLKRLWHFKIIKILCWILVIVAALAILIGGIPYLINYLILKPKQFGIVGDTTTWLSFWGSYIGVVISATIAYFVLYKQLKQNHKENKSNRDLQLAVIKQQQQLQKLDNLKLVSGEYLKNYNSYNLTIFGNEISRNTKDVNCEIKLFAEKTKCIKYNLDFLIKNEELNEMHHKYINALEDLCQVAIISNNQKADPSYYNESDIKVIILKNTYVSKELRDICHNYKNNSKIREELNDILIKIASKANVDEAKLATCISTFINSEQTRINSILLDYNNDKKKIAEIRINVDR